MVAQNRHWIGMATLLSVKRLPNSHWTVFRGAPTLVT